MELKTVKTETSAAGSSLFTKNELKMDSSTTESSSKEFTLEQCFKQIIDGETMELEISTLNSFLVKSLGIHLYNLQTRLKDILPYMLVHFIMAWPGWKKISHYQNNQLTLDNWFKKFKEYLIYKINFMIKNDYDKAVAMLKFHSTDPEEKKVVLKTDSSVQTSSPIEKVTAPFFIEISGPPKVLNSLVFYEGPDDSVIIKEYKNSCSWGPPLSIRQLINWSCTEVEFKSKYLHFKRSNKHEFKRCLTFSSEKIVGKKSDDLIEEINIIDEKLTREAYTLNAIKEFCRVYIDYLKTGLKLTEDIQKEIEVVLEDFILDVVDINMNSFATNTSVMYNIGNAIYARNKSIKTSEHSICFGEFLTPKLSTSFISFTGVENGKIVPFDTTYSTKIIDLCPKLIYRCTFCNQSYATASHLWTHLKSTHIMEQPVLCFSCKLQFKISNLAENRWYHDCFPGPSTSSSAS